MITRVQRREVFRPPRNDTEIATSFDLLFQFIDISLLSAFSFLPFPAPCLSIRTGYLRRLPKLPPPGRLEATSRRDSAVVIHSPPPPTFGK